jgi:HSP20 family protein
MRRIFSKRSGRRRRGEPPAPSGTRALSAPAGTAAGPQAFVSLRAEFDRLFEQFFGAEAARKGSGAFPGGGWSPSVDVVDSDREFTVRAEMPGLDPEDIHLSLLGNSLVLAGEKKDELEDRWKGFVRSERRYGAFRKVIPIPPGVDPDGVAADYDRGILTVHLPKSETRKPRPISITGPSDEKKPARGADH